MRRYLPLLSLLGAVAAFLAACGGSANPTTTADTTTTTVSTTTTAEPATTTATEPETLVIYSGRSEELVAPLIETFEEESGIDAEVRYGSSTEMAATIVTEGASSPADVFYAQDPSTIGSVRELLAPLDDSILALTPERFQDPEGYWTGVTVRSRVLAYNPELVSEDDLPGSFHELTDPAWAGQVGLAPTNGSFLTFVDAMMVLEGEDATIEWLQGMAANDIVEFDGNSPIAAAIDAGDISVGLINHYYLLRLAAEQGGTTALNYYWPNPDAGSYVMPSGAAVLATAQNPKGAAAFIEFLLSNESQTYFAESIFEFPVVEGAPAPAGAPAIDTLVSPQIPLTDLAETFGRATDLITESGLL
ncbi:MAG TPA: extracellular solute-binding protein [Acidimicrobiia bacterium]|nr:extracellular solute-binding protein [Acidimicrobiia bacterium]